MNVLNHKKILSWRIRKNYDPNHVRFNRTLHLVVDQKRKNRVATFVPSNVWHFKSPDLKPSDLVMGRC